MDDENVGLELDDDTWIDRIGSCEPPYHTIDETRRDSHLDAFVHVYE